MLPDKNAPDVFCRKCGGIQQSADDISLSLRCDCPTFQKSVSDVAYWPEDDYCEDEE